MKTNIHFWSYLAQFFLEWKMNQTKVIQKLETRFMCKNMLFPKTVPNMRKSGKTLYSRAGHVRQYNTAHEHCMLDTKCYKHTLRICNTYCFSTAAAVALTRLKVSYTYIACLVSIPEGFTWSSLKLPTKKVTNATANVSTDILFPYPVTNCRYFTIQPVFISENYRSKLRGDNFSMFYLPLQVSVQISE
jgi:hypothetical protein